MNLIDILEQWEEMARLAKVVLIFTGRMHCNRAKSQT
jgi:hypothetical protein